MTLVPIGGYHNIPNPEVALVHPEYYWGMGLTAEAVAREFKISRREQDEFASKGTQRVSSREVQGANSTGKGIRDIFGRKWD
jgi:acetyl-CoA acyltransferase